MGCSGMTCWRRSVGGRARGAVARLNEAQRIAWSRAAIDSSRVRAVAGSKRPSLVDISRVGAKHRARPAASRQRLASSPPPRNEQHRRDPTTGHGRRSCSGPLASSPSSSL
jgi:hypothetical protein